MKYQVTIKETNEYLYFVEANTSNEANTLAFDEYNLDIEKGERECYDSNTESEVIKCED